MVVTNPNGLLLTNQTVKDRGPPQGRYRQEYRQFTSFAAVVVLLCYRSSQEKAKNDRERRNMIEWMFPTDEKRRNGSSSELGERESVSDEN
jgi:hypothetical protein